MPAFDMPPQTTKAFEPRRGAWVIVRLLADVRLGFTNIIHPAGIVGNLAGESRLTAINEVSPMIPGSRGGFGWEQATGIRRTNFEAFAAERGGSVNDDEMNYEFLVWELYDDPAIAGDGSEHRALERLKLTTTLEAAVYTFEVAFERPSSTADVGSRVRYAQQALDAVGQLPVATGAVPVPAVPVIVPPLGTRDVLDATTRLAQTVYSIAGYYQGPIDGRPSAALSLAFESYRTWLDEQQKKAA